MWERLLAIASENLNNQFLSGGLGLMAIGAVGIYLRKVPSILWNLFLRNFTVVVDVQSTEKSYDWLLYWLNTQSYGKKTRRVSIRHVKLKDGTPKTILVPAKGNHWFFYKKMPVWVNRYTDKEAAPSPGQGGDISDLLAPKESVTIRMFGRSQTTIKSLVNEAEALFCAADESLLTINRYQWGVWRRIRRPKRPIESIFFPTGSEDIINEVRSFIDSQDWYRSLGVPYRRGYLFYGPPGTGKSSAAEAIAGEVKAPLYILNLSTMSDNTLESAISEIETSKTSILLIEDIDTVGVKRERSESTKNLSLGTLLNALDGVMAADNLILIMTTNNKDDLDAALTRKGRVDRAIEFGYASTNQIDKAVKRFLGIPTASQCQEISRWVSPITMAEVQENLKQMVLNAK